MKKSLIAAVALVALVTLGGCISTLGNTVEGDKGYLAIPRQVFSIPLPPRIYFCEDGTCKKAN